MINISLSQKDQKGKRERKKQGRKGGREGKKEREREKEGKKKRKEKKEIRNYSPHPSRVYKKRCLQQVNTQSGLVSKQIASIKCSVQCILPTLPYGGGTIPILKNRKVSSVVLSNSSKVAPVTQGLRLRPTSRTTISIW